MNRNMTFVYLCVLRVCSVRVVRVDYVVCCVGVCCMCCLGVVCVVCVLTVLSVTELYVLSVHVCVDCVCVV